MFVEFGIPMYGMVLSLLLLWNIQAHTWTAIMPLIWAIRMTKTARTSNNNDRSQQHSPLHLYFAPFQSFFLTRKDCSTKCPLCVHRAVQLSIVNCQSLRRTCPLTQKGWLAAGTSPAPSVAPVGRLSWALSAAVQSGGHNPVRMIASPQSSKSPTFILCSLSVFDQCFINGFLFLVCKTWGASPHGQLIQYPAFVLLSHLMWFAGVLDRYSSSKPDNPLQNCWPTGESDAERRFSFFHELSARPPSFAASSRMKFTIARGCCPLCARCTWCLRACASGCFACPFCLRALQATACLRFKPWACVFSSMTQTPGCLNCGGRRAI